MEIVAEVNSLEMYKIRQLNDAHGAYRVVEDDGEINYCVLSEYGKDTWYSETEWDEFLKKCSEDQLCDSNLQAMDDYMNGEHWSQQDVDPSHYNDCNGCGHCHLCDDHLEVAADFTARHLMDVDPHPDSELVEAHAYLDRQRDVPEGKTIGQLLREFNNIRG